MTPTLARRRTHPVADFSRLDLAVVGFRSRRRKETDA